MSWFTHNSLSFWVPSDLEQSSLNTTVREERIIWWCFTRKGHVFVSRPKKSRAILLNRVQLAATERSPLACCYSISSDSQQSTSFVREHLVLILYVAPTAIFIACCSSFHLIFWQTNLCITPLVLILYLSTSCCSKAKWQLLIFSSTSPHIPWKDFVQNTLLSLNFLNVCVSDLFMYPRSSKLQNEKPLTGLKSNKSDSIQNDRLT